MHDNYGRWLEATLGERVEELREIVAYHAEQAYLFAKELGRAEAASLGPRALDLLVAAADRARRRDDAHAAWKLYQRASAIAEATGADARVRAHVGGFALLGRVAFTPTDAAAERAFDETIALARSAGPSEVLVQLLTWRALDLFNRVDDVEGSKRIATELPDLARATGDMDLLAEALSFCGLLSYWWNDRAAEERFYLSALEAGRRGTRVRSVTQPLRFLARRAQRYAGEYARAAEYERELASLDPGSSLVLRMLSERHAAGSALARGDFAAAIDYSSRALAISRELGAPFWIAYDEWQLGEALLQEGEAARAREVLEHGAEIMERLAYRGQIPELRARAARACLRLGDPEAARAHVAGAKAALLALDIESYRITAIGEAELAAADGDAASAERVLATRSRASSPPATASTSRCCASRSASSSSRAAARPRRARSSDGPGRSSRSARARLAGAHRRSARADRDAGRLDHEVAAARLTKLPPRRSAGRTPGSSTANTPLAATSSEHPRAFRRLPL